MKIVFMGTPEFAIPSLRILRENKHEILAVVTTPDKERGRGQKVTYTPVKTFALENNIPVLQPVSLKEPEFISALKDLNADLYVVVAFRILPKEVFTIPPKGAFNLHGSLLPKYRGAAPIQWALINGDTETGVTTFFLQDKVDTGNIIISASLTVEPDDDFGSLHDKMSLLGASVLLKTVELIENGNVQVQPQNDSLASPAPKITREICQINWSMPADKIHNLIRGLSPYPAAFFINKGKIIKVYKSALCSENLSAGEIYQTRTRIIIGCGSGTIEILKLQPEGRKRMTAAEFLRGYSLT
ncbi:MAG: methionyl-tRNA formyltransferase [Syntrophothermus sp.]